MITKSLSLWLGQKDKRKRDIDRDDFGGFDQVIILILAIVVIASYAMVSEAIAIQTSGNGEGVNATVLGTFVLLQEDPRDMSYLCVDVVLDNGAGARLDGAKIIDTDNIIHNSDRYTTTLDSYLLDHMNKFLGLVSQEGRSRNIFVYDYADTFKIKNVRFETYKRSENNPNKREQTAPFLVKLNETPDVIFPYKSKDVYIMDLLDVVPYSITDNMSITPEKFYLTKDGGEWPWCTVGWIMGMKLENNGSNPQLIKYEDFKFGDQYGWKYRPKWFTSFDPNESNPLKIGKERQSDEITLLAGETLRIGLKFEGISALSMPCELEYKNQTIQGIESDLGMIGAESNSATLQTESKNYSRPLTQEAVRNMLVYSIAPEDVVFVDGGNVTVEAEVSVLPESKNIARNVFKNLFKDPRVENVLCVTYMWIDTARGPGKKWGQKFYATKADASQIRDWRVADMEDFVR